MNVMRAYICVCVMCMHKNVNVGASLSVRNAMCVCVRFGHSFIRSFVGTLHCVSISKTMRI